MSQIERCRAGSTEARQGELRHIMPLRHGGIAGFTLRYELTGPPEAPLLMVAGGISAGRHVIASDDISEPGWWQSQAAIFGAYRILAIDWVGGDGIIDLPIDPADQAEAIAWLLEELGESSVAAFIGASYGAMVGMHLAARHPHRLGGLLAISAADRAHPFASACRALQRQAVALGESRGDPVAGVSLARAMAILTYRTPEEFAERFDAPPEIHDRHLRVAAESYLDAHGERHCRKMRSTAYRRLSESIDLHRIDPFQLTIPVRLVAVDQDALVPAADVEALAHAIPQAGFHLIHSRYGHDAFLKEEAQVGAIVTQFLDSLETSQ